MSPRFALAALGIAISAVACGHPIVGGECLDGYVQQGNDCVPLAPVLPLADGNDVGADGPSSASTGSETTGSSGSSMMECGALAACGASCVDLTNDPSHCGNCDAVCDSGICEEGRCVEKFAGHAAVLGMDMGDEPVGDAASRLFANAVLLSHHTNVRIADVDGFTNPDAVAHVRAILEYEAARVGRTVTFSDVGSASEVSAALATGDVDALIFDDITSAGTTEASAMGSQIASSMTGFLGHGGVVVAWMSPKGAPPMQALLATSGILDIATFHPVEGELHVSDWLDALAVGEPSTLVPGGAAVSMVVSDPLPSPMSFVIEDLTGRSVVVHRAFEPSP